MCSDDDDMLALCW